jgi:hypothetical protein
VNNTQRDNTLLNHAQLLDTTKKLSKQPNAAVDETDGGEQHVV